MVHARNSQSMPSTPSTGEARRARQAEPWSPEESTQLRRTVKRLVKNGGCERGDALWEAVSRELGGARAPRECKQQYARDYKAHKASAGMLPRPDAGGADEEFGGPAMEHA